MAIINTYPTATPKGADLLIGTQVKDATIEENSTKSFTVDALGSYIVTSTSGITGSGTVNTIAMFTPSTNTVGDSFITQEVFAPGTGNEENRIIINPTPLSNPNVLIVNTGRFTTVQTDSIVASDTGSVTMNGNVAIGNASTDELNILSTTNIWNAPVKSGPTVFGALAPGADYILASTASSTLEWKSQDDYVSGAIAKLIPFQVTASAGGSSAYNADNNIVEFSWTGGNGTYTLFLPTATGDNQYRNIRFVTNSTFPNGASDKVEITALPGETIDGAQFFEISKVYEGVSVWSNGTEWIIIQAKAH
jgi:hypothetical protein